MINYELFDRPEDWPDGQEALGPASVVMRGFVLSERDELLRQIAAIAALAPFRQMTTPGGFLMSAAMTSCGERGWVTDRRGYRYSTLDPISGRSWPAMPSLFSALATRAAGAAGFQRFHPDSCLINRYRVNAKMSLHQDKDGQALDQSVVAVSLGLDAIFQFGGLQRSAHHAR